MGLLFVAGFVGLIAWPQHVFAVDEVTQEGSRFTRHNHHHHVDAKGLDIVAAPLCPLGAQCDEDDYTKLVVALEADDQVTGECNTSCFGWLDQQVPFSLPHIVVDLISG